MKEKTAMRDQKSKRLNRSPFFFLGLTLALASVLTAFEWKTQETIRKIDLDVVINDVPIIETVLLPKPPPPPPKIAVSEIEVIEDDIEIEVPEIVIDTEIIEEIEELDLPEIEEEIIEEPARNWAEQMPEPHGGLKAFYYYVASNLKYPRHAVRRGIEGKVFVQFVVDKDGKIVEPRVIRGIDKICDAEALRVVSESPRWKPGRQGTLNVNVQMVIPITFRLE